jgi:hypothetical protein
MLAGVRRRILGAVAALAVIALAATLVRGGSEDSDDAPRPIRGSGKQVAQVVTQLELATRRRQFGVVCDELFTRAARTRAGGNNCVRLLSSTAKDVRRPRIRLLGVEVNGNRAEARVRTLSQGQAAVEETIDLERERGRYRIAALRG